MFDYNEKYCLTCGHVGRAKSATSGSFFLELVLWCLFILFSIFFTIWILLIPLIYSIVRAFSTKKCCSKCKSTSIIPIDSPIAVAKIAELNTRAEVDKKIVML